MNFFGVMHVWLCIAVMVIIVTLLAVINMDSIDDDAL